MSDWQHVQTTTPSLLCSVRILSSVTLSVLFKHTFSTHSTHLWSFIASKLVKTQQAARQKTADKTSLGNLTTESRQQDDCLFQLTNQ